MPDTLGSYTFLPLEQVLFGPGSVQKIANEVQRLGGQRALVVTGNSLALQTDVVQRVIAALGTFYAGTFHDIRQHAPKSDVARAVDQACSVQADILISVGGGSPIDATKALAYALAQESGTFLPHIALPTTMSAAELSSHAGITDEEKNAKTIVADRQLTPRAIILDAALTLTTPTQLWLSSGIRALDHAVETLYAPGLHPINDVLALEAIRKLFSYLPQSKAHADDLAVRTELQLAAWMSFFNPASISMGLSHNLGRRIGATYKVPHGITSCITLPIVMHAMATAHAAQLAPIAHVLELPVSKNDPQQAAHAAADAVANLISGLALPRHLHEVGIEATEIHRIAVSTVGEGPQLAQTEQLLHAML
jgi:maleylacetate reductase